MTNTEITHALRPRRPTWTHIALRVKDVDATVAWYETFTHFSVLARHEDEVGRNAWIGDKAADADNPFVLVAGEFFEGHDPFAPAAHPPLGPFAHIGIELPSKEMVDEIAAKGKAAGCLAFGPDADAGAYRLYLLPEGPRRQHDRIFLRPGRVRESQRSLGRRGRLTSQLPSTAGAVRTVCPPPPSFCRP